MMEETARDISVILCAYTEERWHDLVAAIESIQQQSLPPREIILVIDHNAALYERARRQLPAVRVIENSEPQGLSGARNSGITLSMGNFVAFLDDDAVAERDWLERLHSSCKDSQVLGVGGVVVPFWSGMCPAWFPKEFYWVIGCTYQKLPVAPVIVRNSFGGCTCMRREVFETIGGFRTDIGRIGKYPLGGEETELCIRAAQHWPEKVFLCVPQARIHHHIPVNRTTWRYFCRRCYAEGLSKAVIARYVGAKDSLSTERAYTYKTLPSGVAHGLKDAIVHRNREGLLRAGAIICGLLITILGYLTGSLARRSIHHTYAGTPAIAPIQTIVVPR